ncbi:uncharacterized protein M6B38_252230 [Iris pallida]|uniref:Reverse transcriptase n=1 Tax=Iris pallida TaxID=29817 RepID=A0AAX6IJ00_IRIPA|nr:uncharacterized protein M6B38_252230 [Iris pallida]
MLYGSECWTVKKYVQKVSIAKTKMLRWMGENILNDRIRNECIHEKLELVPIEDKIRKTRLWWFGRV